MAAVEKPECLDFLQFQDILKGMRVLDDKIIYTLNMHLPTESFRGDSDSGNTCKQLFSDLECNFIKREEAIKKCIIFTSEKVDQLKTKKEMDNSNMNLLKELRKEQNKLRLLQTELGVEEVVKERTTKVYYERCRPFYVPPKLNL